MQYAWTYITSCGDNLSQNPGASFHWLPSDWDSGLACLGWMRGMLTVSWVVPGIFHSSKHHRNYSCYFRSILAWQKVVVCLWTWQDSIFLILTSTASHFSHTVFIVQVSCLSPCSL